MHPKVQSDMTKKFVRCCCKKFRWIPSRHQSTSTASTISGSANTGSIKSLSDVPGPRGIYNIPFIGDALQFYPYRETMESHLYFRHLHKRYGKMARFRLGMKHCLILFDPELFGGVMAHEDYYPERFPVPIIETYAKRRNRAMFNIQKGPEWLSIRSPAQKSIKPGVLKQYINPQSQCAEELVTWLENHGNNNPGIKDALMRYSADANAIVAFDKRIGFLQKMDSPDPEHELFLHSISQFMDLVGQSVYSAPLYKLWRTKLYTEFETAADTVYKISEKYVDEAKQELEKQRKPADETGSSEVPAELTILKHLLHDGQMPKEFIINFMIALLFGGVEQVSQFLMWMFWLLGKSPEKQEKLYTEISNNVEDFRVTAENIGHLPYLKACVKETFRRVPPIVTGITRKVLRDTEIGGYHIPKGTFLFFGNNTLSMSEEYFEKPEEFRPERWLPGAHDPQTQRLMGLCVLPFGMGKRNCLGRRFAEQEIHLAAIKILQKFHVEITEDCGDVRPIYKTFAIPDRPIKFIFNCR
uniref:Cytochrome P450 10-like isoform X1 n=1 Tax=Crassostrea virginica TaxID=6565 RepID=A0A8B8AV89_CRAVI|nr:cytochrome P450 10-like isoform X1 [Crassostrea virginica]XP_022295106.1 cytochrome P450 10-like isoform X1 [Crassostrea virginica]